MSAFGQAVLDMINGSPQQFTMSVKGVGDKWFSFVTDPFYTDGQHLWKSEWRRQLLSTTDDYCR